MDGVFDGQLVYYTTKDGKKLLVEVVCAAGNDARIVNEVANIDKWVTVEELEEAK